MPIQLYKSGLWVGYNSSQPPPSLKGEARPKRQDRKFKLSSISKALFTSRVITMAEISESPLKTFILTYDSKKVDNTKGDLNKFLTRSRRDFGLKNYGWNLELTEKGQFHYHFIAQMPRIDIQKFNKAWSSARGRFSKNSIRAIEEVKTPVGSSFYASKTLKKITEYYTKKEEYKTEGIGQRLWGTSNGIVGGEKVELKEEIHDDLIDYLVKSSSNVRETQFSTCGYVKTRESLEVFDTLS